MEDITLEDAYTDVIAKAQRGLGFTDPQLASQAGIEVTELQQLNRLISLPIPEARDDHCHHPTAR